MKYRYKILLPLAAALLMSGCGGVSDDTAAGTSEEEVHVVKGQLVDAPVGGVEYRCGEKHDTTGQDGTFTCEEFPVNFFVGGVQLGTVAALPSDGNVTPQDLAHVSRENLDENVTKLALFLQSLDADGIIEERIEINASIRRQLREFNTSVCRVSFSGLEEMLGALSLPRIVTPAEAIEHLRRHLHLQNEGEGSLPSEGDDMWVPGGPDEGPSDANTTPPEDHPDTNDSTDPHDDTGTPDSGTPDQNRTDTDDPDLDAFKTEMLELINAARSEGRECGEYGYMPPVPPVTWNEKLYAASLEHSKDMAISNVFSHTGSGTSSDVTAQALHPGTGSGVDERIEYNGYRDWQRYGENIAAGTSMDEAAEAMEGWLESPGHCKNIMKESFKEVGMAVYFFEDSHYKYYWTQDFGTLQE